MYISLLTALDYIGLSPHVQSSRKLPDVGWGVGHIICIMLVNTNSTYVKANAILINVFLSF